MFVRLALLFALTLSSSAFANRAASVEDLDPVAPTHFVPKFAEGGLSIGRNATLPAPYGTVLIAVSTHQTVQISVASTNGTAPAKAAPGMDAYAGTDAARLVAANAPDGWAVRGGQHDAGTNWDEKVYWVRLTGPNGEPVTFEVTWKGTYGAGVTADHVLVDAAMSYLQATRSN